MCNQVNDLPLFLVGCGGLAREVYGWLVDEKSPLLERLVGFLVTDDSQYDTMVYDLPVIHLNSVDFQFSYLLTVGSPESKKHLFDLLSNKCGGLIESFVSKYTPIGFNVTIGKGVIINPRSSISSDAVIGNYVLVNCNTGVGHDVRIGDFTSILGNAAINGDVRIGEGVLIGSGAIIHPNKVVNDFAVVGMGAIVFRNVKSCTTVIGNPAKVFN